MILGIGADIIAVERIKNVIETYGERFLNRIYTEKEIQYSETFGEKKYVHYAARFAAKEAFSKAIGTGISQGFKFKEIGIVNITSGEPVLELNGEMYEKYSKYRNLVTLSHSDDYAVAFVVMEEL